METVRKAVYRLRHKMRYAMYRRDVAGVLNVAHELEKKFGYRVGTDIEYSVTPVSSGQCRSMQLMILATKQETRNFRLNDIEVRDGHYNTCKSSIELPTTDPTHVPCPELAGMVNPANALEEQANEEEPSNGYYRN